MVTVGIYRFRFPRVEGVIIFFIVTCCCTASFSQSDSKGTSTIDSLLNQQRLIQKKLSDIERRDSLAQLRTDNLLQPAWDYLKDLQDDTKSHREFIQEYYKHISTWVTVILGVFGVFFGFLGFQSYKQIETRLSEIFESRFNKRFKKLWEDKSAEVDKKIKELLDEMAKHQEINKRQSNQIELLDQEVTEIKKNIHVVRSAAILEYIKSDGSELILRREQEIICSSTDYPIRQTEETIEVDAPGEVSFLEGTKNDSVSVVPTGTATSCKIIMTFKNPLKKGDQAFIKFVKCRFTNGFMNQKEGFIIEQPYPCDQETFELKFKKKKNCEKVWVERRSDLDQEDTFKEFKEIEIVASEDAETCSYKMVFPPNKGLMGSAPTYRVCWKF